MSSPVLSSDGLAPALSDLPVPALANPPQTDEEWRILTISDIKGRSTFDEAAFLRHVGNVRKWLATLSNIYCLLEAQATQRNEQMNVDYSRAQSERTEEGWEAYRAARTAHSIWKGGQLHYKAQVRLRQDEARGLLHTLVMPHEQAVWRRQRAADRQVAMENALANVPSTLSPVAVQDAKLELLVCWAMKLVPRTEEEAEAWHAAVRVHWQAAKDQSDV